MSISVLVLTLEIFLQPEQEFLGCIILYILTHFSVQSRRAISVGTGISGRQLTLH